MIDLQVTPERLGVEIRELTRQAKAMTLYYGVEIGRRLTAAKELVPYGSWGGWLQDNTEFSQATATRFMRLFDEYGADQIGLFGAEVKSSTLQNLSISNALRLLAVPEEERVEFAEQVDADHISARELERAIKERDEAKQRADEAEKMVKDAEQELQEEKAGKDKLERALQDLQSRPPEVKIQRDEAAIKEAVKKEKEKAAKELREKTAEWNKKVAEAKKEQERLAEQLEAAKAKALKAENSQAKERLEEEIEALRKKLAMTGKEIVAAGVHFGQWQQTYNQMIQAIGGIEDADKAQKLKAAIKAQLSAWMKTMEG